MKIGTKLLRGKYYCYATITGYDYSFESSSLDDAQQQMRVILNNKNIRSAEWEDLEIIKDAPTKETPPPIGYANSRIDNNPIA